MFGEGSDFGFLLPAGPPNQIADRDDTLQRPVLEHGQVPPPPLGHQRHRLLDLALDVDANGAPRHDASDRRGRWIESREHDANHDVALGEDADELVLEVDEQGADSMTAHRADGLY